MSVPTEEPPKTTAQGPPPQPEEWGCDLLLYGPEQDLRGPDEAADRRDAATKSPAARETHAMSVPAAEPPKTTAQEPPPQPEEWGYDLLLYGHEQVLRGSDTGVLVAFAALAFQQIRGGDPQPHNNVGFGILLFSVLMCAVIHFAMGNVYVGRARRLILRRQDRRRHVAVRGLYTTVALIAGILQLGCIILGLVLVLLPEPPPFLEAWGIG